MARPHVYVALPLPDQSIARIVDACEVARYGQRGQPSRDELIAALASAEGLLGSAMLAVDEGVLDSAPRLRVVSNFGVGYNNVDVDAATRCGILVCNTPGVLSDAVADLTMGFIISLARRLPEGERFVRDGRWAPGQGVRLGNDLRGKMLGIIGMGRIGREVAQRARAFGMDGCFYDAFEQQLDESLVFCAPIALDDLLRDSDYVSLHVNLTPETHHIIGARELSLMKPGAYLVNTSRGQVIDQPALVEALRSNTIAGAALDVLEQEPPAADEPLLQLDNALVLPHIGSATVETRRAMLELAIDNLLVALRGETPQCVVNPEALATRRVPS
ncbi:MAG: D-glycerate dehydrogenase [Dehalococcoidia bacterium]